MVGVEYGWSFLPACASKSTAVTKIERLMCTLVLDVDPVADSVVTRRIAEALRMSVGAIRLYACH